MFKKVTVAIVSAVSVLLALMFTGFRIGFIFADHEVFSGFCYAVWALFIANAVVLLFQLRAVIKDETRIKKGLFIANTALCVLSVVCASAFFAIGADQELLNFYYISFETLPYLAAFFALIFFVFVFPATGKLCKRITAALTVCAIVISGVLYLFPLGGFAFECSPSVFDFGDAYHVVFATNRESLGYVEYTYNGENYKVWDDNFGRKDTSVVHSISVPYEHLDNNSYKIGAVRVWEDIAYGGHTGKEISEVTELFVPCPEDDFTFLCITDNHASSPDWAKLKGDYDAALFLGDVSSALYSYDSFIKNLIIPAGILTDGSKPVMFVRGNHEIRGSFSQIMLDELGLNQLYYRIKKGDYTFTVLDSGEDHVDDYYEYAGFNCFESYLKKQTEWLSAQSVQPGYNVVLSHSPSMFSPFTELNEIAVKEVNRLGAQLIVGGHFHRAAYIPAAESESGIANYICGSRTSANSLNYTVMDFSDGKVQIKSYSFDGEIINEVQHTLTAVSAE